MACQDFDAGRLGSFGMHWVRFWYIFQAVWNALLDSADHPGGRVRCNTSFLW